MPKRPAKKQLTMDNYDDEDDGDEIATAINSDSTGFAMASEGVLSGRKIAVGKRRVCTPGVSGGNIKASKCQAGGTGLFASFSFKPPSSSTSTPVNGFDKKTPAAVTSDTKQIGLVSNTPVNDKQTDNGSQFMSSVRVMNTSFVSKVTTFVNLFPLCDLTDMCQRYINMMNQLKQACNVCVTSSRSVNNEASFMSNKRPKASSDVNEKDMKTGFAFLGSVDNVISRNQTLAESKTEPIVGNSKSLFKFGGIISQDPANNDDFRSTPSNISTGGAAANSSTESTKRTPSFNFGFPASDSTKERHNFTFGTTSGESAKPTPGFKFGSTTIESTNPVSNFKLGTTTNDSTKPIPSFTIGSTTNESTIPKASFTFGTTTNETAKPTASFKFGTSTAVSNKPAPDLQFASTANKSDKPTTSFTFGSTTNESAKSTPSIKFGTPSSESTKPAPDVKFGTATKQTATFTFGTTTDKSANQTKKFTFGTTTDKSAKPTPSFTFGATTSKSTKPVASFKFGISTTESTKPTDSFKFGTSTTESTNPTPSFNFGISTTESTKPTPTFKFGTATSESSKPASRLLSATTGNIPLKLSFGSTSNTTSTSTANSTTGVTFGAMTTEMAKPGTGFTFGTTTAVDNPGSEAAAVANDAEGEYVPPVTDVKLVVEEDSKYSIRCKLFYQHEGEYKDKGVGMLYLKQCGEKVQLLVRADTNLGNILLNIMLVENMTVSRVGKNNVMLVCVPNPPLDIKGVDPKLPVTMLIRVKGESECSRLLLELKTAVESAGRCESVSPISASDDGIDHGGSTSDGEEGEIGNVDEEDGGDSNNDDDDDDIVCLD